jgi:hypothetical protein
LNSFSSDHSEQDRSNKGERSENGEDVNPAGENHVEVSRWFALPLKAASRQSGGEAENHPKV